MSPGPEHRFADLVGTPGVPFALDQACLLVSAALQPGLDVEAHLSRIDALADGVPEPTIDSVRQHLFGTLGFTGDRERYYAPQNSFLDTVLDRRKGLPITLSILMVEVARRVGVAAHGVGMPGHFLVRSHEQPHRYFDPFSSGIELDRAGCRRLFTALHGADAPFDPAYLQPTPPDLVVLRLLANLRQLYTVSRAHGPLTTVLRLVVALPAAGFADREELARVLEHGGSYAQAAEAFDALADDAGDRDTADALRHEAIRARARLN